MLCKGKKDQALLEIALCKTCKKSTRLSQMMKQVHPLSLCRCAHIAKLFSVFQRNTDHSFPTLHRYFLKFQWHLFSLLLSNALESSKLYDPSCKWSIFFLNRNCFFCLKKVFTEDYSYRRRIPWD